jgi:hypothetical protein
MASGRAQAEVGAVTLAQNEDHDDQTTPGNAAKARQSKAHRVESSPPRSATSAFERGDHLFQLFLELEDRQPLGRVTGASIPRATGLLNSVCNAGWEIVSSSLVPREPDSSVSNTPAQNAAIGSSIIAYYLFRRREEQQPAVGPSAEIAGIDHVCPHCGTGIEAHRTLCLQCHWWRSLDDATRDGASRRYRPRETGKRKWRTVDEEANFQALSFDGLSARSPSLISVLATYRSKERELEGARLRLHFRKR